MKRSDYVATIFAVIAYAILGAVGTQMFLQGLWPVGVMLIVAVILLLGVRWFDLSPRD